MDEYIKDPPGKTLEVKLRPFKRVTAKVGRNDSCPCGSGKKQKKCCDKIARLDAVRAYETPMVSPIPVETP